MSQTERLVYITRCLKEYGQIDKQGVCEKFEVDSRTVARDIEYLRDRCDCTIEYNRKISKYTVKEPVDIFSPGRYLLFYAYVSGIAKSLSLMPLVADEISECITRILDRSHSQLANAIIYRFPVVESYNTYVLDELIQSFKERVICDIVYIKPGNPEEKRQIEPFRFINYDGQWYVLAFCHSSGAKRQFNLSRILSAVRTTAAYSSPVNDEELDNIVKSGFGIMRTAFAESEPCMVMIRFSGKSAAIVAGQEWHPKQIIERKEDANGLIVELTVPVESYEEIMRRVLFYGPEAEAVSPLDFREMWLRNIREMYKKYCEK
ncbi:MAG: WYL domain-containing protein [Spirochaetes bacterium]|nr:WYL domain-containing protein [Spirochaetota bacterium]